MDLFSSLILNEALPQQQQMQPTQQQLNTVQKKKIKAPPTQAPPDLTKNSANANNAQQQNQQQQMDANDPQMQQQQDGNMDAMGGNVNDPSAMDGSEVDNNQQQDNADQQQDYGMEDPNQQENPEDGSLQSPQDPSEIDPKEKEQELFATLKPEQLSLKQEELKRQFKNLYDSINGSLEKLKKVSHTSQDDHLIDFLVRKLLDIRDISRDYLVKTFDTKSYVENQIQLQRLISIFSMITTLVSNVYLARVKREIASEKKTESLNKSSNKSTFYGLAKFEKGIDVQ